MTPAPASDIAQALKLLEIDSLVLAIHDACFPQRGDEDVGRGSPYADGAVDLLAMLRQHGFTGIQLGPQGLTSPDNPSPYDSTLFSRNPLSIALAPLARDPYWGGLLTEQALELAVAGAPPNRSRSHYRYTFELMQRTLRDVHRRFERRRAAGDPRLRALVADFEQFCRANRDWLEPDSRYQATFVEPDEPSTEVIARYQLAQFLVHRQHAELHARITGWGLSLAGDLQIGMSARDLARTWPALLPGYRLGAPPSRTNSSGQPWGYRIIDPRRYRDGDRPGAAVSLFRARLNKMFSEYDAVRIDHPHGLVCPWVYRDDLADPVAAVQSGARLFESPDLPDHPALAPLAIARRDQLNPDPAVPRHADDWVVALEPEQVARYSTLIEVVAQAARDHGFGPEALICEVLSTQPYPLAQVMQAYGLGRFRVTQKADLDRAADVYRVENARPEDWVMVSTHDTASIWERARRWQGTAEGRQQADYLAARLAPPGAAEIERMARRLRADHRLLAHAKLANALTSRARHVMIFFTDLLGIEERYNVPGLVSEDNWCLRVPPDFASSYPDRAARRDALDLRTALGMALRARCRRGPPAPDDLLPDTD